MNEVTESIRPLLALAFPMSCALLILPTFSNWGSPEP